MDLVADFVFSDTMMGRYLPDEKVLYIIDEVLASSSRGNRERAEEMLFGVMAHELVHAYDDQVYNAMPDTSAIVEIAADPVPFRGSLEAIHHWSARSSLDAAHGSQRGAAPSRQGRLG